MYVSVVIGELKKMQALPRIAATSLTVDQPYPAPAYSRGWACLAEACMYIRDAGEAECVPTLREDCVFDHVIPHLSLAVV